MPQSIHVWREPRPSPVGCRLALWAWQRAGASPYSDTKIATSHTEQRVFTALTKTVTGGSPASMAATMALTMPMVAPSLGIPKGLSLIPGHYTGEVNSGDVFDGEQRSEGETTQGGGTVDPSVDDCHRAADSVSGLLEFLHGL